VSIDVLTSLTGPGALPGDTRGLDKIRRQAGGGDDDDAGFATLLADAGGPHAGRRGPGRGHGATAHVRPDHALLPHAALTSTAALAVQCKPTPPSMTTTSDVEDSLWTERTTARGKADSAKRRNAGREDVDLTEHTGAPQGDDSSSSATASNSSTSQSPSWTFSTLTPQAIERIDAVAEVPPGPLMVATDHLRALLPEGGRVLAASAQQVRLELPHPSGPMMLEVSLRSGVVDVRARGGAAAEMAWRVPELAAALQSAGVRLGAFEVAPVQKSGDTDAADDGRAGDRQKSDDPQPRLRRTEPRGIVAGLTSAFTTN
jgi:hypothetical protein